MQTYNCGYFQKGDVNDVLEEMHALHLESYQKYLSTSKDIEVFENEMLRLVEENVKNETIKRFIKLR